jgi:hypothetical protein
MNKLFNVIASILMIVSISSCTNNDNDDNLTNSGNYFPLTLDNYWNYNVTNSNLDLNQSQSTRDSLYVNEYGLAINGIATGTMNTILTQMDLTRTATRLSGTGNITFPFEGLDDFQIGVTDAQFYNTTVSTNNPLSSVEGIIEQTIEGLPITASYTLKTTQGASFPSLFLNSINYENVIESSIILELTITTQVEVIPGNFIEVLILDTQNVLEISNHYAKDIGLVQSEADISYHLEDFSSIGITLPVAGSLNATSLQTLDTYVVAEE